MATTTTTQRVLAATAVGLGLLLGAGSAEAQEILLTGPLAGAPAVREMRLYREGRIEVAPAVSFTLLDEYQRTIFLGARANYNLTDWFAVGGWLAWGGLRFTTGLTDSTQDVHSARRNQAGFAGSTEDRLTAVNMGNELADQLAGMDWVLAPQITGVPFRGKLALFGSAYLDTDLYFFAGPAFVGVTERKLCTSGCGDLGGDFGTESRVAIAPTFGLGFTFYINQWNSLGLEWRGLPFALNAAGFDTRGKGEDLRFPDDKITEEDRVFRFNQMLTISYNFYFPKEYRLSE